MGDLTGLAALDVAIGLAFLYFLLSTLCSTVSEWIAGMLGWRAATLEQAIRRLIVDPDQITQFWNDPRIRALGQPFEDLSGKRLSLKGRKPAHGAPGAAGDEHYLKPSYIPADVFALAVFDTIAPNVVGAAPAGGGETPPSQDAIAALRTEVESIGNPTIRRALLDVLDGGRAEVDDLRIGVEKQFDNVMDRASGWYKRRAQKMLLLIAVVATVVGNVDSVNVAKRLFNDDALRASVVARATAAPGATLQDGNVSEADAKDLKDVADAVDDVKELGVPVGWNEANVPDDLGGVLGKLLGFLATIGAIMLGAPFWFDALGKLARLRTTGKREGTLKDDARAAEDVDDPARRRRAAAPGRR